MKRIEIIFSQSLEEDLVQWIEAASQDLSPKPIKIFLHLYSTYN